MYLLDTDILIDIQRGHTSALVWFASLPELPSVPGFVIIVWETPGNQENIIVFTKRSHCLHRIILFYVEDLIGLHWFPGEIIGSCYRNAMMIKSFYKPAATSNDFKNPTVLYPCC